MDVADSIDRAVSGIALAIGEPARARILYCLMDGHARTSTELAIVADVSPSTASAHLSRLSERRLVTVFVQGKHRYYSLDGPHVAAALEALSVLAGTPRDGFVPRTPPRLRHARTCYDHIAGSLGVALHDACTANGWITASSRDASYDLSHDGERALVDLGIDVAGARALRRRFACACLDWSERRPHLGGALGAAMLTLAQRKKWIAKDEDSRIVRVTASGRRELRRRFGVELS